MKARCAFAMLGLEYDTKELAQVLARQAALRYAAVPLDSALP